MLQYLVGMDHVEGRLGQVERVHVADQDAYVGAGHPLARHRRGGLAQLEGADLAGGDAAGEVDGDGAGPGADVEQVKARAQPGSR
ncbi:hypothetical protein GCM10025872_23640 [Barrientosiimonas endolithica]|uniref:Uncharacterized protein n=1 Tax=Barrientosiimonas endolithica TaxID=1535208 RepID=A0ABN6YMR9_9MICO|nr:hypothetical protein GCM10025872_23640 [Barrientosiimonas endolithica]